MRNQVGRAEKRKLTPEVVKKEFRLRQDAGLQKIEIKQRQCLRCEKEFESYNVGNRLCTSCVLIVSR